MFLDIDFYYFDLYLVDYVFEKFWFMTYKNLIFLVTTELKV